MATATQSQTRPAPAAAAACLPTWATVTTLREPPERVKAFVAHHLYMGASEIWLFFDDPEDPAIALVEPIPAVRVVRCTPEHKAQHSNRAGTHEGRQKANANLAYAGTGAGWVIHLDADELVQADRPVAAILSEAQGDVLRLAPFEALHYAKAGRNGRPAHYFRGALPDTLAGRAAAERAYGRFAPVLAQGMLSHTAGKHFVRAGLPGITLSIHAPFRDGRRLPDTETPEARLLHFHGGDWDGWRAHLERRLSAGAYVAKFQGDLFRTLSTLKRRRGEAGLRAFWTRVCTFGPDKRILKKHGALWRGDLWLDAKVAALFGGDSPLSHPAPDPETGAFEADATWEGLKLRLVPDNNFTERLIARGEPVEEDEIRTFRSLVSGRRVLFYDIGANAGIFSLVVAQAAAPGSRIIAFEPNPEMRRRFVRNVALNGLDNIEIRPVALGNATGETFLSIVKAGNLGQASLRDTAEGAGYCVPLRRLSDEMAEPAGYDRTLMKIDVEGHEAGVLAPLLDPARTAGHWPDYIMLEHSSAEDWGLDLIAELMACGYVRHALTADNTFLKRQSTRG